MGNLISTYAEKFKHNKQIRRRAISIVAVLAIVVSCGVFWELHSDGVAMANETFCGMEEHQHNEDCYETVLVCGEEEFVDEEGEGTGDHIHDDSCYERALSCDIPEHTHTVDCLIDDTADVETSSVWEATLPNDLTGVWADDVVSVANSQIGYTESEANFQLAEDGETRQGYSRYGAWYGNEYGDWDAMFASFCLHYAGVPESSFPEASGAYAWSSTLKEKSNQADGQKLYTSAENYIPEPGDLAFFDIDEDGKVDYTGIIEKVKTSNGDGEEALNSLTVIEGDSHDTVERVTYDLNSTKSDDIAAVKTIKGYGLLPDQTDEKDEGAQTTLTYEGPDYVVTVTYADDIKFPEGAVLNASEYDKNSETYLDRYEEAAELYGWNAKADDDNEETEFDAETILNVRLFNIKVDAPDEDGEMEPVELAETVQTTITYLSAEDDEDGYMVTYFGDDEDETESLDVEVIEEDEDHNITFETDELSDFMVTGISEDDYGIMTLGASADRSYFEFISMDDTLTAHHGSGTFEPDSGVDYILDNGNYFHLIDSGTKHVSEQHMFNLSLQTLDTDHLPSSLSIVENPDASQNDHLLCLDISSISGGNNPSADTLDENVEGTGYTFKNVGTITFENAGTVAGGIPVDVQMTFDEIRLYNCFSAGAKDTSQTELIDCTVPIDQKFHFANFGSGDTAFWISQNYTSNRSDGYHNGYSYPVNIDVNMTINIVFAGTDDTVDMSFLMAASDIDGYQANARHGYYKETFKTLDGFNGNYYIYPSDADFIASYSKGVVTVQSSDSEQNYNGDDAYTLGGIYADSTNGEFQVGYSEGWCGTRVEIYDYTSNDITIQKEDIEDSSILLDGAEFIVYKDVSAGDQDYPYDVDDPKYGADDPVRIYYSGEQTVNGTVYAALWSTEEDESKKFKTGDDGDGQVVIRCLYPCDDYYLEEVTAPDGGYNVLNEPIKFQVTSYGTVILETSSQYVSVTGDDGLTIIVKNGTAAELPNTGGSGTYLYTLIGLLLIGGAVFLLFRRRREVMCSG